MNIHQLIRRRRRELDLSQQQVATQLGTKQSHIAKWEDKVVPSMQNMIGLCCLLGISLEEIDKALKEK